MAKLSETIRELTRKHLIENNGLIFGQCLSAVGWVGGTVPELTAEQGIMELPTSDSSNGGIVVGAALAGRKPIYLIRYQGFGWYNFASILNYAAKSKEMWDIPCSLFVRSLGMEGGIGPVAGGQNHSIVAHMPGVKVVAPMTSNEWEQSFNYFLHSDEVVYCSEHRTSFALDYETIDIVNENPVVTILAIGGARLKAIEATKILLDKGITTNLFHVVNLKPLEIPFNAFYSVTQSKYNLVVDSDHTICGIAEHIACYLMQQTSKPVYTMGLKDKTAGFSLKTDNLTPSPKGIVDEINHNLY